MKLLKRTCWFSLVIVVIMVVYAALAFAYIDPGTGSYIFQMLIAFILGAAFTVKIFWNRIKGYWGAKKENDKIE